MNWGTFQTYNDASDKAFEVLCNQLFENWCRSEYKEKIESFNVVNGAGGDGGVESYATLTTGEIIAMQAKWFLTSIDSNKISQIRNSIKTAISLRPNINRYIVCVPRDLSSLTAKSENTEENRWNNLVAEFPKIQIELWNDTRITTEIQKDTSVGINRYWFSKTEISKDTIRFAFEKGKSSWLSSKYVPDLNENGVIKQNICRFLGDEQVHVQLIKKIDKIKKLYSNFDFSFKQLLEIAKSKISDIETIFLNIQTEHSKISLILEQIDRWLTNDTNEISEIAESSFYVNYEEYIEKIQESRAWHEHYFHTSDIVKILKKLSQFDYYQLVHNVKELIDRTSYWCIGDPGTGKTHGVASTVEEIIKDDYHSAIIIQAKEIPQTYTWHNIVMAHLGLSSWGEDELFQGLISMVNRNRFKPENLNKTVKIQPKFLIIVDGIDESSLHEKWIERIKETAAIVEKYPQLRFFFTSRPSVFPRDLGNARTLRLRSDGDVSISLLFDKYIKAYNVNAKNKGWLKYALTTPLSLKLFCELNQNKKVSYSKGADLALSKLLREKINKIEEEFVKQADIDFANQYIHRTIMLLTKEFYTASKLERSNLVLRIKNELNVEKICAEKLLKCLEQYGIIRLYCEHSNTFLSPNTYFYYSGIQGYFDYASALLILDECEHPEKIQFDKYPNIPQNSLYGLAVISMQEYGYLITKNPTIKDIASEWTILEIQFWALRHSSAEQAQQYKERCLELMAESADNLITITNSLILPLSRDVEHPLGVMLLDEFLLSFSLPAERDIIWSVSGYLRDAYGKRWYRSEELKLGKDEYGLTEEDVYNGCPIVYAWALACVNNSVRQTYRNELMKWAKKVPEEFLKLFLKFSTVNDPQILSDMFSIMMCLVYELPRATIIKEVSQWIMANVLHPSKIDLNRNISVRYYSIAILRKAISMNIISVTEAISCLPPYHLGTYDIKLSKEALAGTRMSGYSGINYDLARYVLVDHFESAFYDFRHRKEKKLERLIKKVVENNPDFCGITVEKFIISAAFAYITEMGWKESEFRNLTKNETDSDIIGGVDCDIGRTYYHATHGQKSNVMTIAEKYVWQAKDYISGFLCDRLPCGERYDYITDYGMLNDFTIPVQEMMQIDPDNIPEDNPWHNPEPNVASLSGNNSSKEEVIRDIVNAPDFDWVKWIDVSNNDKKYKLESEELLALSSFSCFYGTAGVETCLFINSIILNENEFDKFILKLQENELSPMLCNPTDWYGGIETLCYITPKEVCWFDWKNRYESMNCESFPEIEITSAVDKCCYNYLEYGDVEYYMPSTLLRAMLNIKDSDGYAFKDDNDVVKAEYCVTGEKWGTYQDYVLVDKKILLSQLHAQNKKVVWIMKEYRREDGKSREKHGGFYADKEKSYIGYFNGSNFEVKEIYSRIERD